MSDVHISYTPRPDATSESELIALAGIYRFVLKQHAARAAAAESCRHKLEGGVDEPLTKEPDEDVVSSPVAKTQVPEFPRDQ